MRKVVMVILGLSLVGCVFQEMRELPAPDLDMPQDMVLDVSDMPKDIPVDIPNDIPVDIPNDMPLDIPVDIPNDIPVDIPVEMPKSPVVCGVTAMPESHCDPIEQICGPSSQCRLFVNTDTSKLEFRCGPKRAGQLVEGDSCSVPLNNECTPDLTCINLNEGTCLRYCRMSDALGCDGDGDYPACTREFGTTGFGTCQSRCF